jgi:D-beta-D-heptose 7-phosphate kinase/D-beta-D-heptose 1-phosphate adenosyltransferase
MRVLHNSHPHILVIGDLMIDHYLWGGCERISPEAPVQVVDIARETTVLGGAGNVINNLVALGAQVSISGVIGDDENGEELCAMLDAIGVKSEGLVKQKGRKTSKKAVLSLQTSRFCATTKSQKTLLIQSVRRR